MHRLRQRLDVTLLARVDGADGHARQLVAVLHAGDDHLDFEFEALFAAVERRLHHAAAQQAIARLIVAHRLTERPGEQPAPDGIGQVTWEGHLPEGALADDQIGFLGGIGLEKAGNFGGIVLPVGIEHDHRVVTGLQRPAEARSQGRAFALVGPLTQHCCAGVLGQDGGVVGRAVVHHQHRQIGARARHHRPDALSFVVGGDERQHPRGRLRIGQHHGFVGRRQGRMPMVRSTSMTKATPTPLSSRVRAPSA